MKKIVFIILMLFPAGGLMADSVMDGLFDAAGQISDDVSDILRQDGDLLISGIQSSTGQSVKLGDLFADLLSNRLASARGFSPGVIKHYATPYYRPDDAAWVLSGSLYEVGTAYLLTFQLTGTSDGILLKGWEFAIGSDGIDDLLYPSVLSAVSGTFHDRYEPNDSYMNAYPLELPFFEAQMTLTEDDEDWFAIEVDRADGEDVLMLEAYTGGGLDTYMELYAPGDYYNHPITENDDSDGSNAGINYVMSEPGTWYLKVRGYSSSDEGEYSLTVDVSNFRLGPGEPDEDTGSATRLNLDSAPLEKLIDYNGDEDWFRIELSNSLGRNEVLIVETFGNMDLVMELRDEYNDYITDDDDSGSGSNPQITASGLSAGTYYAVVSSYDYDTGPYEITAAVSSPVQDEYEDDDSMDTATQIRLGAPRQERTFSPPGDKDWAWFEIRRGGDYVIRTHGDIDTYMELYDEDGYYLEESDDEYDYNAGFEIYLDPGIYYVQVTPYGSSSIYETYELSLEVY